MLDLLDYRRQTADIYSRVRAGDADEQTWLAYRSARDRLFATHPQSALAPDDRDSFRGIAYYDYDPALRFVSAVTPIATAAVDLDHSSAGTTAFEAFGSVSFSISGQPCFLTVYWLTGYGGGVFLPFRDATNGSGTYAGGRYVLDTVKGADLGSRENELVIDFNYAYHPSCVHSPVWSCPLSPAENTLAVAVRAGERL